MSRGSKGAARENPRRYSRRVLPLGALGYVVIGTALAIVVGLTGLVFWLMVTGHVAVIKFIWPLAVIGYVLSSALSVRIEPPGGLPIMRSDAPALFEMIDGVVDRVRSANRPCPPQRRSQRRCLPDPASLRDFRLDELHGARRALYAGARRG